MKTYALFILAFLLVSYSSPAEIKNGYGIDIKGALESLKSLNTTLSSEKNLSESERKKINSQIEKIQKFIAHYDLTTQLLAEFRIISPALYDEINFIKDHEGRPVDVYVKVTEKKEFPEPLKAFTNVGQDKTDKNAYSSEYGFNTVSVKVANVKRSSILLAHEFGHIRYLVPNLAMYVETYINYYKKKMVDSNAMGHQPGDPSGRMARTYEGRFAVSYYARLKSMTDKNL